jgi:hypothetical protein
MCLKVSAYESTDNRPIAVYAHPCLTNARCLCVQVAMSGLLGQLCFYLVDLRTDCQRFLLVLRCLRPLLLGQMYVFAFLHQQSL